MNLEKNFTFIFKDFCPSCHAKKFKILGMRGGKFQRDGLGEETKIVQCNDCSLIFPNPFPIPDSLESLYGDPDEYFSGKGEWLARSKSYEVIVKNFVDLIDKSENIEILDVGAGRGELNKAALSFPEVICTGLEVSEGSIAFAKEHGIVLEKKLLTELINEGKTYDGICLNAVLEHVHEPGIFMSEVSSLLRPGGVLYIDVPREPNLLTILGNFSSKLVGSKAVYNLQPTWEPYHVFGFNPKSLKRLLDKNDIEISSIRIYGAPSIPRGKGLKDMIKVFIGINIQRFANKISLGSNMFIWAKRKNLLD